MTTLRHSASKPPQPGAEDMRVTGGRTAALTTALVFSALLITPFADCAAFDLLEGLWPGDSVSPPQQRQVLTREELLRMRQSVHDVPLRQLNADEQALLRAAATGDVEGLKKPLAGGINVSLRDFNGDNALALAVRGGHFEAVRELLSRGAWPSGKAADGLTPLAMAAVRGHVPIARALLRAGARADEYSDNKNNALTLAVLLGHSGVTRELLKHGADTALRSGSGPIHGGQPPLVMATVLENADIVKLLLDHGADPNLMDRDRQTALTWALLRGNRQIAETLLAGGSDLNLLPLPICKYTFEPGLSACQ